VKAMAATGDGYDPVYLALHVGVLAWMALMVVHVLVLLYQQLF